MELSRRGLFKALGAGLAVSAAGLAPAQGNAAVASPGRASRTSAGEAAADPSL